MTPSEEFKLRLQGYSLVTVNVLYYMPDAKSIVNEFIWQTMDIQPRYPRVERFLDYWRKEIDAIIKEVLVCDAPIFEPNRYRNVTEYFKN